MMTTCTYGGVRLQGDEVSIGEALVCVARGAIDVDDCMRTAAELELSANLQGWRIKASPNRRLVHEAEEDASLFCSGVWLPNGNG